MEDKTHTHTHTYITPTQRPVKRGHFEILQKKTSNMPRVVWAEESKTGLGFKIGP